MKIAIHRPRQIGGQITEITSSKGTRIIIDLGQNLPNAEVDHDPLNNRETIERLTKRCDAVLYTHYHGDHIGLCRHVPATVPQYIGSIAKEVMRCKYEHMSHAKGPEGEEAKRVLDAVDNMLTYEPEEKLVFGDIEVTPYFVSHSACDSHMFLIEVGGKRILHTGDFREHSKKGSRLIDMLKCYIGKVDVLTIEGTMLSRGQERTRTEEELTDEAKELMQKYKYVFVLCSSTDPERLYDFVKAHRSVRPKALLMCDGYQNSEFKIFSTIVYGGRKMYNFRGTYIYDGSKEKILKERRNKMCEKGFTMFIRPSDKFHNFLNDILPMLDPKQTLFIYSMWSGYIDLERRDTIMPSYVKLYDRFSSHNFKAAIQKLHTSGHATMETLRKVCETLKPVTAIIPIHRDADSDFGSIGLSEELKGKVVTENCSVNGIEINFID